VVGGGRAVADALREDDAQVDREHRGQRHALGLDAVVDLAGDREGAAGLVPLDGRGEAGLRQAEQGGDALRDLVAFVVLRQLAGDQQVARLLS
jgi:hypothetical protein